jgi:nonribosomal peptide synthetase CepB
VSQVDAADLDERELGDLVRAQVRAASGRLDPFAGVMIQAVWLDCGSGVPGRLVLVVHHLVVDGVSWRVLLPDLAAAYAAVAAGKPVHLDPVGTSFRRWASLAAEQALNPARVAELPVWERILSVADPLLAVRPLDPVQDTAATMRRISVSLPSPVTGALLTSVPVAFHAGISDVLLAGLVVAIGEWRVRRGAAAQAASAVLVDVEGHGREALAVDVDLSRTVGWFTAICPVGLDLGQVDYADVRAGNAAAGRVIQRVKEQLRAIPGDGLGYGLLRYLNRATAPALANLPMPQVSFNYLGRFTGGSEVSGGGSAALWQVTGFGGDSGEIPAAHVLETGGAVRDAADGPELSLVLSWPQELLSESDVRQLAQGWAAMLTGFSEHAGRPGVGGHTPSDFPLLGVSQGQLDVLQAELGQSRAADTQGRKRR